MLAMAIWHWTECLIYHFNNFAKKCCSKADIEKTDYGFPLVSTRLIRLSLGFNGCQNKPNLSVSEETFKTYVVKLVVRKVVCRQIEEDLSRSSYISRHFN